MGEDCGDGVVLSGGFLDACGEELVHAEFGG